MTADAPQAPEPVELLPLSHWRAMFADVPKFLVEGRVLTNAITLLYGKPKVGKSFLWLSLAHALTSGASTWLGSQLHRTASGGAVIIGLTDYGSASETVRRADALGCDDHIIPITIRPDYDDGWWMRFADEAAAIGAELVIIDNIMGVTPLDLNINDDSAARQVCQRLGRLLDRHIPVVAVHHQSSKGASKTPLGSTAWSALVRSQLCLTRDGKQGRKLTVDEGAGSDGEVLSLQMEVDGDRAAFVVTDSSPLEESDIPAGYRRRANRRPDRMDKREEIARVALATCAGLSKRETATSLAEHSPEHLQRRSNDPRTAWETELGRIEKAELLGFDSSRGLIAGPKLLSSSVAA